MKLSTSADLSKALARLIRGSLAGKVSTTDLGRYASAINVLAGLIRETGQDERLDAIEREIGLTK